MADLLQYLKNAGFSGEGLKTAWGIAQRESHGNPAAYNPNRATGDDSYGLFQINMLGKMGPARRAQFGIPDNKALLDPNINARAAFKMSKGGTDFGAWGIGPNAYRKMPALDFTGYPGEGSTSPQAKMMSAQAAKNITLQSSAPVDPYAVGNFTGAAGQLAENQDQILHANRLNQLLAQAAPSAATQSILGRIGGIAGGVAQHIADNPVSVNVPKPVYVDAPPQGTTQLAPVGQVIEGNTVGAQAVRQAATQLGKPYVFGSGPDTSSFDCSDLVQWSYKQLGIDIPRDTQGQQKALPLKPWADLQPGDPIYRKSGGHVVIYAGNGKVIAAPHTGTVVQYQSLDNFPQSKWEVRSISQKGK